MYRKYKYKKIDDMFSAEVKCNGKPITISGVIPKSVPKDFEQDYINLSINKKHKKIRQRNRLRMLDVIIGGTNDAVLSHAQRR